MSDDNGREDVVHTRSVARGVAVADDVVLVTTATTRTVFKPALVDKGVRGWIVRQKIGRNGEWVDSNEVDFRRLPADCGVSIEIDSQGMAVLLDELRRLYEVQGRGVEGGEREYVVGPAAETVRVRDRDTAVEIQRLVEQGHSAEMWRELAQADPALADRLAASQIQVSRSDAVLQFASALVEHSEDEAFWQAFLESHPWMLQCASAATVYVLSGDTYIGGKLPTGRGGRGGVATDFVTADASTKSFGVVEIKTPSARLVGPVYRGDPELDLDLSNVVHSIHAELSGAIVQTRNQISVAVEDFQGTLARHPKGDGLNRLHPKGILISGTMAELSPPEQASFNQFRQGLQSLTILTFDELLRRLSITYEIDLP